MAYADDLFTTKNWFNLGNYEVWSVPITYAKLYFNLTSLCRLDLMLWKYASILHVFYFYVLIKE